MGCCDSKHQDDTWITTSSNNKKKERQKITTLNGGYKESVSAAAIFVIKKRGPNKAQAAQERLRQEHEALGIVSNQNVISREIPSKLLTSLHVRSPSDMKKNNKLPKNKGNKGEAITQIEDDPLFSSMDSESLAGIPDDSYFYKLPMNQDLLNDRFSKRKSSCQIPLASSKQQVIMASVQDDFLHHTFEFDGKDQFDDDKMMLQTSTHKHELSTTQIETPSTFKKNKEQISP